MGVDIIFLTPVYKMKDVDVASDTLDGAVSLCQENQ